MLMRRLFVDIGKWRRWCLFWTRGLSTDLVVSESCRRVWMRGLSSALQNLQHFGMSIIGAASLFCQTNSDRCHAEDDQKLLDEKCPDKRHAERPVPRPKQVGE
eukprot:1983038-Prymnesium_polylepis.2